MTKIRIADIIKTSIVTAFTIATALIWKDVIIDGIKIFVPQGDVFFYKLVAAIIATLIIIVAIYVWLRTESSAENYFLSFRKKK
jgi:hypothetical protein